MSVSRFFGVIGSGKQTGISDLNLKAYWKFNAASTPVPNDSESAVDLGANANLLEFGNPTYGNTGKIGDSVGFDGTGDFFESGTSTSQFNFGHGAGASISHALWLKFSQTLDSAGHSYVIFDSGGNTGGGHSISLNADTGSTYFYAAAIHDGTSRYVDVSAASSLGTDDTNWHFIVWTYNEDNAQMQFSEDGDAFSVKGSLNTSANTANAIAPLHVGVNTAEQDIRAMTGDFDEWSTWSEEMNIGKVGTLYNSGAGLEIY